MWNISAKNFLILDGKIEISVDLILHVPSTKIHYPVEFQAISNTSLFISE
jgi:hypothetical protein